MDNNNKPNLYEICANCGQKYGYHYGTKGKCPHGSGPHEWMVFKKLEPLTPVVSEGETQIDEEKFRWETARMLFCHMSPKIYKENGSFYGEIILKADEYMDSAIALTDTLIEKLKTNKQPKKES